MKTVEQVAEFHRAFNLPADRRPGTGAMGDYERQDIKLVAGNLARIGQHLHKLAAEHGSMHLLRLQLIVEECAEVAEAIADQELPELLKELCDLQYVVDGTFIAYGLDGLKSEAFSEVHRSNMSKLDENGHPIIDAAGRVVKSDRYQKADVGRFLP